ncbi:hypothetical protein DRE_00833 [Drechslerella stenobrocha 248]|uniref:Uncharacterized protein n=1 Tax=Drechslerella stenobrocha 248 TaxID=1043628 RepID=W7HQJ2_9PEZI|nr:hypothetical protein DRE_00833 [Drechslerella stenobrocha 248]
MDGYNRGYPGYQYPQQPPYGGTSGRADGSGGGGGGGGGGGRNLNHPQPPSNPHGRGSPQAFYGSQHAGFTQLCASAGVQPFFSAPVILLLSRTTSRDAAVCVPRSVALVVLVGFLHTRWRGER